MNIEWLFAKINQQLEVHQSWWLQSAVGHSTVAPEEGTHIGSGNTSDALQLDDEEADAELWNP